MFYRDIFIDPAVVKTITEEQDQKQKGYELDFVRADLETYNSLSSRMQKLIINYIDSASQQYKIPIGLLHAILRVESDYKYWIDHPTVIVKGKSTCAKGIAGIVWEYWKDSLITKGIAERESDLYSPEISIKGCAYILREILNKEVNNSSSESLALRIAEGYFGKGTWGGMNAEDYKNKLIKYTSDLWMIRMTKVLKEMGKYKESTVLLHIKVN